MMAMIDGNEGFAFSYPDPSQLSNEKSKALVRDKPEESDSRSSDIYAHAKYFLTSGDKMVDFSKVIADALTKLHLHFS